MKPKVGVYLFFYILSTLIGYCETIETPTDTPTSTPVEISTPSPIQNLATNPYPSGSLTSSLTPTPILKPSIPESQPAGKEDLPQGWKWKKESVAISISTLSILISGACLILLCRKTREQMLASFRERLFSRQPYAGIAAAMKLSKYPREAVWLLMRWAEEQKNEQTQEKNKPPNSSKPSGSAQLKQSILDALRNMGDRPSWVFFWKQPKRLRRRNGKSHRVFRFLHYPLLRRVQGARLDRMTLTLPFGAVHLPRAYMAHGNFYQIGLQGANLYRADLESSKMKEANLQGASLEEANLRNVFLFKANLQGAKLWETCLQNVDLNSAVLDDAELWEADLQNADMYSSHLRGTVLYKSDLRNAKLGNADLQDAKVKECNLQGSILWDADFRRADLEGSNIFGAKLFKADFRGAMLEDIFLSYASCQGAILDLQQIEMVERWNREHRSAPWLGDNWETWWHKPKPSERDKKREIMELNRYMEKLKGV